MGILKKERLKHEMMLENEEMQHWCKAKQKLEIKRKLCVNI